jgi:hypothetical protein
MGIEHGRVLVEQGDVRGFLPIDAVKSSVAVGQPVSLKVPALSFRSSPGFAVRKGVVGLETRRVSRLYLNLRPAQAGWCLQTLGDALDMNETPYVVKVLAHPGAYRRRDAGVLYVPSEERETTIDLVRKEVSRVGISLGKSVPVLTEKLAPGIGFADEPSDVDASMVSFGHWVSRLFLEAAKTSHTTQDVRRSVVTLIENSGRDPARPFARAAR